MQKHSTDVSDIDAFYHHVDAGLPVSVDIKYKPKIRSPKVSSSFQANDNRDRATTRRDGDSRNRLNFTPAVGSPSSNRKSKKNGATGELSKAMDKLIEICDTFKNVEKTSYLGMEMNDLTDRMRNMIDSDVVIDSLVDRYTSDSSNTVFQTTIQLGFNKKHAQLDYDSDQSSVPSYSHKYDLPTMELLHDTDSILRKEESSHVTSALQITVIESEDAIEMDSTAMHSISTHNADSQDKPLDTLSIAEHTEFMEAHEPADISTMSIVYPENSSSFYSNHDHIDKGKSVLTSYDFYGCLDDEWSSDQYQSIETDDRKKFKIGLTEAPSCILSDSDNHGCASVELFDGLGIEVSDLLSHITKEEIVATKHISTQNAVDLHEFHEIDSIDNEATVFPWQENMDDCLLVQDESSNDFTNSILIQTTPLLMPMKEISITLETQTETIPRTLMPCDQNFFDDDDDDARLVHEIVINSESPTTVPMSSSRLTCDNPDLILIDSGIEQIVHPNIVSNNSSLLVSSTDSVSLSNQEKPIIDKEIEQIVQMTSSCTIASNSLNGPCYTEGMHEKNDPCSRAEMLDTSGTPSEYISTNHLRCNQQDPICIHSGVEKNQTIVSSCDLSIEDVDALSLKFQEQREVVEGNRKNNPTISFCDSSIENVDAQTLTNQEKNEVVLKNRKKYPVASNSLAAGTDKISSKVETRASDSNGEFAALKSFWGEKMKKTSKPQH